MVQVGGKEAGVVVCAGGERELDSHAAATYLGVSVSTLYLYCDTGDLPYRNLNPLKAERKRRRFRFLLRHLEAFRQKQFVGMFASVLLAFASVLGAPSVAFSPLDPPPMVDTDGDGIPDAMIPASVRLRGQHS
ncbi:MAG TPA: helix-turn-helix domain-containing protein [Thermoanaerobaculia bacterium]|nr:helix-turn-helix domain-containing protein [Thermoanaerobaculia bacterium]